MPYAACGPMSWEEAVEFYDSDDLQECPQCGDWHSIHSPVLCHACAMGLKRP